MKHIKILLVTLIGWVSLTQAQILEPVKWSFEAVEAADNEFELQFKAVIDDGWHLYSHYIEDGGPIPTTFYFDEDPAFSLNGKITEEGDREAKYDDIFEMDLAWFKHSAVFSQKVSLVEGSTAAMVKGELEFMVCNDKECLPPEYIPFKFKIGGLPASEGAKEEEAGSETEAEVPAFQVHEEEEGVFLDPVKWSYRASDDTDGSLILEWKADLDVGWHIYAHDIGDDGPIPTTFYYDEGPLHVPVGDLEEIGDKITKFDEVFEMELSWYGETVTFTQVVDWKDAISTEFKGSVEFMVCDEKQCLPPEEIDFVIDLENKGTWVPFGRSNFIPVDSGCEELPQIMCPGQFDEGLAHNDCSGSPVEETTKNYWLIFLIGFGGGLIALLTPCVFPMIPLTVSFFTKGADKANSKGIRNAFIYGISIVVIYVSLGLIVTLGFGPEMLNWIATDPIFNVFFFLIFVFFAFSFFGYYELTLPQSWTNKTDQIASKGGLIGIFFMAFTLALVSFSCTGPIIGSLIVEAVKQGVMGPFFGMLGFAVALALPFTLFAIFPKWLNSLPQSGGWLNSVKVFLGFLELAFALKFLSTADLTKHWGFLKYEIFIGLWIIIFLLMGLYFIGAVRFPHDSKTKVGQLRRGFGMVSILFSAYLLFGMVQQKPLLGGIAPAPGYSLFNPSKCPIGVNVCFHDYEEGMEYARDVNKPVMLDFTGYGCVNCRLMENNVWTDPEVNKLLNEYVIISLYVDDRAELPLEQQYISTATGKAKEVKKVGKYWHDFQFRHFGTLSQPYYVLVGPNKEILNKPVAFTGKDEYLEFLSCGLNHLKGVCPDCTVTETGGL